MADSFDAIVIGAGEAGTVIASLALEAGHRVAMVYRPPYGSTCLNTGCVPSKFLIHRAKITHVARTASRFHVETSSPRVDLAAIVSDKNALVAAHRQEALEGAHAAQGLTLVEGEARFVSPHEVEVGGWRLGSDRSFIATGMRPAIPQIAGLDRVPYLTNETLMEMTAVPERLVVLGGGYVACELGQAYARFGARVTILQSREHLLPEEEADVSTMLERALSAEGIDLVLGSRAVGVESVDGEVLVTVRARDGSERTVRGSHLLVATGRRPNTDGLDLSRAGVETDERGFIRVNERLETSAPSIWAVGDVNGQQPFTRVCQEEAKVAYANAFTGAGLAMPRSFLPHAVFTDPEVGSVGLTEQAARDRGYEVAAGLVTFDRVERAELMGETSGLVKFVVERRSRRVLGCHVIGPHAAELVYDAVLVMRRGGTLDEIAKSVGVFPTLQEGIEGTARGLLRKLAPDEVTGPLVTARVGPKGGEIDAAETEPALSGLRSGVRHAGKAGSA